ATPFVRPLEGIRAVTWSVYGTLLHIADGRLVLDHPQRVRMQIALEKTIQEFNVWQSMTRKPGEPWAQLYEQYQRDLAELRMQPAPQKGDVREVNAAEIWRRIIDRLRQKDYEYDAAFYGDADALSEKVAYFFHAGLQGVEAAPHALDALAFVSESGRTQGLLADAQPFTLVQLLRVLRGQGTLPPLGEVFTPNCLTLSFEHAACKPSRTLYRACLERLASMGIGAEEVLHVGSRLRGDLAAAKSVGMRTALYAGDSDSLEATREDVRDPQLRPDRLITDLAQIREVLAA
ncbi:MAG: HAD family hydrolase, partial [Planctomycetaceae bacterium]